MKRESRVFPLQASNMGLVIIWSASNKVVFKEKRLPHMRKRSSKDGPVNNSSTSEPSAKQILQGRHQHFKRLDAPPVCCSWMENDVHHSRQVPGHQGHPAIESKPVDFWNAEVFCKKFLKENTCRYYVNLEFPCATEKSKEEQLGSSPNVLVR